jgi:hypothetical protein
LADAVTGVLRTPGDLQRSPDISVASRAFPAVPPAGTQDLTLPRSGVGELGGAEDGRTVLYAYGWHGGVTAKGLDAKLPALDLYNIGLLKFLQKIIGAPGNCSQTIPVAVAEIGNVSLAAIPTEMTTLQGVQLREELLNSTHRPFVLIGLANEYIGYTATEAEYAAQDYESASTMYGKRQGAVIGKLLEDVAQSPKTSPDSITPVSYNAGAKAAFHFGPEFFGERYNLPYEDLDPAMPDPERQDPEPHRRIWTAIWAPPKPHDRAAQYVFWVKPPWKAAVCSDKFRLGGPVLKVPMDPAPPAACPPWSER